MDTKIHYEVRLDTAVKSFSTEKEARQDIENARTGYANNTEMRLSDRDYWRQESENMIIVRVIQLNERIY